MVSRYSVVLLKGKTVVLVTLNYLEDWSPGSPLLSPNKSCWFMLDQFGSQRAGGRETGGRVGLTDCPPGVCWPHYGPCCRAESDQAGPGAPLLSPSNWLAVVWCPT